MSDALLCDIYKSPKKEALYLYVAKETDLTKLPEELLKPFGEPKFVMTLRVSGDRKFAAANAEEVLRKIVEQGFYLQLPPQPVS